MFDRINLGLTFAESLIKPREPMFYGIFFYITGGETLSRVADISSQPKPK